MAYDPSPSMDALLGSLLRIRCETVDMDAKQPPQPSNLFSGFVLPCTLGCIVVATLFAVGCKTTPLTERKQLLIVSEEEENQMGLTAYQQVMEEEPVSTNQSAAEMVKRVGERIAAVADRPDFKWEFNVIESPTQNAFCLPGGKVAVYTGILPVCETEAGLAVVMSHEIGHAIARHGGERMSHQMVENQAKTALEKLMKNKSDKTQQIVLTAYGAGAQYGAILPYSRKHELEADQIGLLLMAKAGYDPSEAPEFWERFAGSKQGETPMEFLSTHPSDAHRSSALREQLPEAMEIYEKAQEKLGSGKSLEGIVKPGV